MVYRVRALLITAIVFLLLLIIVAIAIVVWKTSSDDHEEDHHTASLETSLLYTVGAQNVTLRLRQKSLEGQNKNLPISFAVGLGVSTKDLNIIDRWSSIGIIQMQWTDGMMLNISKSRDDRLLDCLKIDWIMTKSATETATDCIDIADSQWYGGFEESYQHWPINKLSIPMAPFVTGDAYAQLQIGDVIEPLLISSLGIGVFVDEKSPLYISFNYSPFTDHLCLIGRTGSNTPFFGNDQVANLSYQVCRSNDMTTLWKEMARAFIPKPVDIPSLDVLRYPIWSTWAMYKGYINQTTTLEYANDIRYHGFGISQLEIDDNWTPKYGDLTFDPVKFPDARSMVLNLAAKNIPVTVWMHPFFNNDSKAFRELSRLGYLIKIEDGDSPALTKWWRGRYAGILDVTNPEAVEWYLAKTSYLQSYFNVTSFKFDAGEINWLPKRYKIRNKMNTPNDFTRLYATMAFQADTRHRRQEVRVGFKTQSLPVLVRMIDRDSTWSHEKGLKSLIPTALTLSIMGYPFVLPDMIGGNAYDPDFLDKTVLPEAELFIRWLQVTTFMPTLQFSVAPWVYNDTVVNISRKFVELHEEYADTIISLAKNSVSTGEPILRPLWWIAPNDPTSMNVDTEFMLGNGILIAPVLERGENSRDIYLPKGRWRHGVSGQSYSGPTWLRQFQAPLDELPYFFKL